MMQRQILTNQGGKAIVLNSGDLPNREESDKRKDHRGC